MTNNFHRYLNLPFEIKKPKEFLETPKYVKHLRLDDLQYIEIDILFRTLGLECGFKEAFFTPAKSRIPIHTDLPKITNHVKLNITWGPKEGEILWWNCEDFVEKFIFCEEENYNNEEETIENKPEKDVMKPDRDGLLVIDGVVGESNYHHFNRWYKEENSQIIYRANTNKISLVNVGIPHSTYNPTEEGRWTLCFGVHNKKTKSDLIWSDALKVFEDYIVEE